MSNACFGKTTENSQNRREIRFVYNRKQAEKTLLKPTFKSYQSFHIDLVSFPSPHARLFGQSLPLWELPNLIRIYKASTSSTTMKLNHVLVIK